MPLRPARMATTGTIPMPALRMGITVRRGLRAVSLLVPVRGSVAVMDTDIAAMDTAIAVVSTDGLFMAAATAAGTAAATVADTLVVGVSAAPIAVVAVVDSTAVVVAVTLAAVTGKFSRSFSKRAVAGFNPAAALFWC
jgi:hypothetical protein